MSNFSEIKTLYVFLMTKGELIEIDNHKLQECKVFNLKAYLTTYYNLQQESQILLINGGDELYDRQSISECNAGENPTIPIYVFLRSSSISPEKRLFNDFVSSDLLGQLDHLAGNQPADESALTTLPSTVRQLITAANDGFSMVKQLDNEQRLMCEGWFIAQANFTQMMRSICAKMTVYWKAYDMFCGESRRWADNLRRFASLKARLQSVPFLPTLLPPAASDLTAEFTNAHTLVTLYDWICLQISQSKGLAGRFSRVPLVGPIGTGQHLTSSSTGSDLALDSPSNRNSVTAPRPIPSATTRFLTGSLSNACGSSFYISTSSPNSNAGTSPGKASLETTLLEMVKDARKRLKVLRGRGSRGSLYDRSSSLFETVEKSILSASEEDDDEEEEEENDEEEENATNEPQLALVYSHLKEFCNLLEIAPSELDTQDESKHCCSTTKSPRTPGDWSLPPTDGTGEPNWRHSRQHCSNHLKQLSHLKTQLVSIHGNAINLLGSLLTDWRDKQAKSKKFEKQFPEVVQRQQSIFAKILSTFNEFKVAFDQTMELKLVLAESISHLQRQMQAFSSEVYSMDREYQKCFRSLNSISLCSVLLDQLRDTPELYIKCLLEVVRRRKLADEWSTFSELYVKRLSAFQQTETSRREGISNELKDHILLEIFRPLQVQRIPSLRPIRQLSRISLISNNNNNNIPSSSKHLTRQNKCLSASHLNAAASQYTSPFRLPSNRVAPLVYPAAAATTTTTNFRSLPPQLPLEFPADWLDRSLDSLSAVSVEELYKLKAAVPDDLAHMIDETLEELATTIEASLFINFDGSRPCRRRSRLLSSPCSFGQSTLGVGSSSSLLPKLRCVSVATSTETEKLHLESPDHLASICERPPPSPPTNSSALGVPECGPHGVTNYESFCPSYSPHPSDGDSLFPSDLLPTPPRSESSSPALQLEPTSEVYLSMFTVDDIDDDDDADVTSSRPYRTQQHQQQPGTSFHSIDDSHEASMMAPEDAYLAVEVLSRHNDCLEQFQGELSRFLPCPVTRSLPDLVPKQTAEDYLNRLMLHLHEVTQHLKDAGRPSEVGGRETEAVGVQTTCSSQAECHTECRPKDFLDPGMMMLMTTTTTTNAFVPVAVSSASQLDSSLSVSIPQVRLPRIECVFYNFRTDDVVLFVPVLDSIKHPSHKAASGVPKGEDPLSRSESPATYTSRTLAMLSSAIISDSLVTSVAAPPPSMMLTTIPEQWRMLSSDGHVYFLHDDDFEAFGLARLAQLQALNAPTSSTKRGHEGTPAHPTLPPPFGLTDRRLPSSRRALPFIAGLYREKEKCLSKTGENRFGLEKGFVFFRVRARPL